MRGAVESTSTSVTTSQPHSKLPYQLNPLRSATASCLGQLPDSCPPVVAGGTGEAGHQAALEPQIQVKPCIGGAPDIVNPGRHHVDPRNQCAATHSQTIRVPVNGFMVHGAGFCQDLHAVDPDRRPVVRQDKEGQGQAREPGHVSGS
eukprot:CAMPEP_0202891062 /NCGR_PEP_ID=MMETSP1392-20130828/1245_1 /ASSEMBLY_ACC=CAM_ASM_000868 /TAXON_ID=225041 /ORGANISM="Chlamydomonas chlamydogama, Strain SAG 11-48b" /LENGTH=146 /DNA_ID=CAMNT_0049574731 /DNA_START=1462 /DNA_END=1903 /DNA_ORIENTATION=+